MMDDRGVILIAGPGGSGKTSVVFELIEPLTRVIVLDAGFGNYDTLAFLDLNQLAAYLDEHGGRGGFFKVSYTPAPHEFGIILAMAKQLGQIEPVTLVIEEADRMPRPDDLEIYGDLIARGRHYGVHMIMAAPRPVDFNIDVRSQATEIYSFLFIEPQDLKWLRGANGALEAQVRELPAKYEYARFVKSSGDVVRGFTHKRGGDYER
jgi:hypothetical protein